MPAFYKEWFYKGRLVLVKSMLAKPQPKPTTFVGPNSSEQLCRAIGQFGLGKLLVVTDKPLRDLGVLDNTLKALETNGITVSVFDGVQPDPTTTVVDAGLAVLHKNNCDAVLAIGGGSSIDCAKVIALAAANNKTAEQSLGVNSCKLPALPFFAIPTTAGTGSEGTCIAVISNPVTHAKEAALDNCLIPKAAALDPVMMQKLPPHITAATGMDALTHAIESYISTAGNADTDFYGLASAKLVFENLEEACSNGDNLDAREAMAVASYYGGLAISQALVGYVHAVSHNLGAKYGVPHGLGNALVLPHVLEMLKDAATKKMAEIAVHSGLGSATESDAALAQKLVDAVWALNKAIGIPKTTDVIQDADIDHLVTELMKEGASYATPRYFEVEESRALIQRLRT